MSSDGKVAIVTGANRGIGLEVCRQLAHKGHRVILTARDSAKAEVAARTLRATSGDVVALQLDVTDPTSVLTALRTATSWFQRVDVLVNNAAVLLAEDRSVLDTPLNDFRDSFETNVIGVAAVSQAFVPGMVRRGYGRIVNVSSGAGQLSRMGVYAPAYSISKAALNAFTRQLAAATEETGVLVNCMNPGWVRTDMGGTNAPRSVEQGADTIVWLATLPSDGPSGEFFSDRRQIEW
jgi:NAD(P)-dependent dehydrogenase (short-subunit alcohol dehydrogenase family)